MFTSPMLIFACDPQDIEKSRARDLITEVPVTWDQTVVLPQSRIGELAVLARRKDRVWYVTCLNGEKAKQVTVMLDDFLPEKRNCNIELVQDGESNRKVEITKFRQNSSDPLKLDLRSGGGFLLKVIPVSDNKNL
jgi:alpha-glucosidase